MDETAARADMAATAKREWGGILAFGIITALFGVVIMAYPDITLGILVILLGIQLVVGGIFDLVGAFSDERSGMRWLVALIGVIAIGVGLLILFNGDGLGDSVTESVKFIGYIVGIVWLLKGVVDGLAAIGDDEAPHRGLRLVGAVITAIAGLVVLAWPGKSLVLLTWIVGIWFLLLGILVIVMAFVVRGAAKQAA